MKIKNVIVGAGLAGCLLARRIAEEKNENVLIIEKRNHIGGNCYDFYNEHGLLVHKYGPHIFHTNESHIWKYLSQFTEWHEYQHKVLSYVDGMKIPFPISISTLNILFNENITIENIASFLKKIAIKKDVIENSADYILSEVGEHLYEKFFKNYSFKQWGIYPDQLSADVIKRIPIRFNIDNRYFTDKYQGLPKYGYFKMFENIVRHEKIKIILNANWNEMKNEIVSKKVYYTGKIDEYFDYSLGTLDYRSLKFIYETFYDREFFQETGCVNYPNDYDYTRITEFKHLTGQHSKLTTIAREYPSEFGEPYYVVLNEQNISLYNKYNELADKEHYTYFIGRLAEYKYYDMDKIVEKILKTEI